MRESYSRVTLVCAVKVETGVAAVFGVVLIEVEWESDRGKGAVGAGSYGAKGIGC